MVRMAFDQEYVDPATAAMLRRIGAQLKEARQLRMLTQGTVAAAVGVHQSSISRVENGRATTMKLRRLARLLAVLDADITIN